MQLDETTVLVTGGSSGLGRGCVEAFCSAGARVVVADLNRDDGEQLAESLGDRADFYETDVTSAGDVEHVVRHAIEKFGPLRGVVNCAGILGAARVVGRNGPHDLDLFRRVVEVNLVGTFNVVRLTAAAMSNNPPDEDDERGVIVNTSSVAAYEGQIGQAAYSATKGGVASMTLPVARELARYGIRVVAVAPGVFRTPMMQAAPPQVLDSLQDQTVFPKRLGQPADFASLARHIFENRMLNGEVIRLDGAIRMGPN